MLENFSPNLEGDGFGIGSHAELAELRKALDIGTSIPPSGSDVLRVESLEATLKILTFRMTNLKLWNMVDKTNAFSTVEEFNRLVEYGSDAGSFVSSGVLPEEEDSVYARDNQLVKFLGTTRAVNHPATLVRSVPADLIARETTNGALFLLGKLNASLYFGNADAVPVEWNGYIKQIEDGAATNIIDLRGQSLTESDIENAAQSITDNFGIPSKMFSNGRVFADFSKIFQSRQRVAVPPATPGVAGTPMIGFNTVNGLINFESDVFVKRGAGPPASATSVKAPSAPTVAPGAPGADASSVFTTGEVHAYQVTALNQFGESAPTALTADVTYTSGDIATHVITDGGGANGATAYKVYRTKDGASNVPTFFLGFVLPRAKVGGVFQATTDFIDRNTYIENMFQALMLDMTPESLTFRQLSPMIKMPLAQIAPSIRWMQLLYGTPIVYAPKKNIVFRNVGVTP